MRTQDLASSSLASCPATLPMDGPLGFILEEFDAAGIPADEINLLRSCVVRGLKSSGDSDQGRPGGSLLFDAFRKVYLDASMPSEVRKLAIAAGIACNDPYFGESYQHYADELGLTRACIHTHSRTVQKVFGVKARRDKSDSARAGSALRASGPRSQRPVRKRPRNPARMFSIFRP